MTTGTLRMIVWNVKRGNAISLHLPNGKTVMIDCGNSDDCSPVDSLNKQKVNKIDWLVITHPHTDHMADLRNIVRFGMYPTVLTTALGIAEASIKADNKDNEAVNEYLMFGQRYNSSIGFDANPYNPDNMGGVQFKCFTPVKCAEGDLNNRSLVIAAEYGGTRILFMGDCTNAAQRELLEDPSFVEVVEGTHILVVPHHGHESSYCPELMRKMCPWICIASDAKDTQGVSATDAYGTHCSGRMFGNASAVREQRFCLTTRKDGYIVVDVPAVGGVSIHTGSGLVSC